MMILSTFEVLLDHSIQLNWIFLLDGSLNIWCMSLLIIDNINVNATIESA